MHSPKTDPKLHFDPQAAQFEARAGLSDAAAKDVVDAVVKLASLGPQDQVVEIGAGTGEIGRWFVQSPVRYLGLDDAALMLEQFAHKIGGRTDCLLHGDANESWPVESRSVRVIFGSRVFHLLDAAHVAAEAKRVALPDRAYLLSGRVQRDPKSPKAAIRTKMRELLVHNGLAPRNSDQNRSNLWAAALQLGARELQPVQAAQWSIHSRPMDAIDGWKGKDSMGGIAPPAAIKSRILDELAQWASSVWGRLDAVVTTQEFYVLEGVQIN